MIYAVIDLGSNSVRMSVYRCEGRAFRVLFTKKEQLGLAGHIENGRMNRTGIALACYTLNSFQETLENLEIARAHVFATASLRNASNKQEVLDAILRDTGYSVEIISGEEEAKLGFSGAIRTVQMTSGYFVDIGGGSMELARFENRVIERAVSLPHGSLNTTMRYTNGMIPTPQERSAMDNMIRRELKASFPCEKQENLPICAIGGSARAAARIVNYINNRPLTAMRVSYADLKGAVRRITAEGGDGLNIILRVVPERVRTMAAGLVLLKAVARHVGSCEIVVSSFGVREGYLIERLLQGDGAK